jgi:hypothetical protein
VVHEIASHVAATRSLPARYVLRLLPVSLSCFASQEEVAALAPVMVQRFFGTGGALFQGRGEGGGACLRSARSSAVAGVSLPVLCVRALC